MDVLIAGAGVGGLALAHGLRVDGHQVRVLEQAPGPRSGGAAVTIFSNGAAALDGLGISLDGIGGRIDALELRSAEGRRTGLFDLRVLHRRTGYPVVTVPRDRLLERLALPDRGRDDRVCRDGVSHDSASQDGVSYGSQVTGVTVRAGAAVAVDATGAEHPARVVVGADGHRSAVRRAILDGTPAAEVGWATWQGLTPVLPELATGHRGLFIAGAAGAVGLMPAGDGLLQWWFDAPVPPDGRVPPDAAPAASMAFGGLPGTGADWLRARFGGYPDPVPDLLATVADADLGYFPHVVHRVPDRWGVGPTTLVGDAAHAFPPSQAQGANQALEDAWLLRLALRSALGPGPRSGTGPGPGPDQLVAGLRRYERVRARQVRRVSRMAASEITNKPAGPVAALLAPRVPAAVAGYGYLQLIRSFSSVLRFRPRS